MARARQMIGGSGSVLGIRVLGWALTYSFLLVPKAGLLILPLFLLGGWLLHYSQRQLQWFECSDCDSRIEPFGIKRLLAYFGFGWTRPSCQGCGAALEFDSPAESSPVIWVTWLILVAGLVAIMAFVLVASV